MFMYKVRLHNMESEIFISLSVEDINPVNQRDRLHQDNIKCTHNETEVQSVVCNYTVLFCLFFC